MTYGQKAPRCDPFLMFMFFVLHEIQFIVVFYLFTSIVYS